MVYLVVTSRNPARSLPKRCRDKHVIAGKNVFCLWRLLFFLLLLDNCCGNWCFYFGFSAGLFWFICEYDSLSLAYARLDERSRVKVVEKEGEYFYRIAEPEKALCDQLYTISPVGNTKELFRLLTESLRIEESELQKLDASKVCAYSAAYHTTNIKKLYSLMRRI